MKLVKWVVKTYDMYKDVRWVYKYQPEKRLCNLPLLSIGQMIEFLDDYACIHMVTWNKKLREVVWKYKAGGLCDVLWEDVKAVLGILNKVIKTEKEYKIALRLVEALMNKDPDKNTVDGKKLRQLATLVENYESKNYELNE